MTTDAMTQAFYNTNAHTYYAQTVSTNMGEIYKRFLHYMPPLGKILDVGCGSGRDMKAFKLLGYVVTGCDPSEPLAHLASTLTGEPVTIRTARDIHEVQIYDGIWACASLLHIPRDELDASLRRIAIAAKDKSVFYCSFKRGEVSWRDDKGRYFVGRTVKEVCKLLNRNGFYVEDMWQSGGEDNMSGRAQWINAVSTRRWRGGEHQPAGHVKTDAEGVKMEEMVDA